MGGDLHVDVCGRGGTFLVIRKHELRVGVLVVDHQQRARPGGLGYGEETDVIVVVAELQPLGFWRLLAGVEGRCPTQHWITPADERLHAIPRWHKDPIVGVQRYRLERQPAVRDLTPSLAPNLRRAMAEGLGV